MLRDLDKELSAFARERREKRAAAGGGGGGAPKSLWEELYDIGEEFVDFLEQVALLFFCFFVSDWPRRSLWASSRQPFCFFLLLIGLVRSLWTFWSS